MWLLHIYVPVVYSRIVYCELWGGDMSVRVLCVWGNKRLQVSLSVSVWLVSGCDDERLNSTIWCLLPVQVSVWCYCIITYSNPNKLTYENFQFYYFFLIFKNYNRIHTCSTVIHERDSFLINLLKILFTILKLILVPRINQ